MGSRALSTSPTHPPLPRPSRHVRHGAPLPGQWDSFTGNVVKFWCLCAAALQTWGCGRPPQSGVRTDTYPKEDGHRSPGGGGWTPAAGSGSVPGTAGPAAQECPDDLSSREKGAERRSSPEQRGGPLTPPGVVRVCGWCHAESDSEWQPREGVPAGQFGHPRRTGSPGRGWRGGGGPALDTKEPRGREDEGGAGGTGSPDTLPSRVSPPPNLQ